MGRTVGYDEFVDQRIAKTRVAVKTADLATGAVVLLAWGLLVLLVAAVADHWLVQGGLGPMGRFALFGIGAVGALLYLGTRLGPTLLLRVNPLYAARELERESPELKNSLLNVLQLRGGPDNAAVRQTLERQAAERLAGVGDAPIDHTPLVRAAKLLLALVAVAAVYIVASPKDFFASAGRVLAPWSRIAAPSRVKIADLAPGDTTLAQGDRLEVSATVTGLRDGDLVELVYSTTDKRLVDRRVPMRVGEGGRGFKLTLPTGSGAEAALGLQGDLTYRLEAGDARTRPYRVNVETAPTIAPVSVTYTYPPYTGYSAREVEGVGDLRAIEGTRVTLTAQANLPLESAQIDLGADGRPDYRMRVDGERAEGRFTLKTDGRGDHTTSYVLRFTSDDGRANNNPPQYRVEVIADLPPEVAVLEPEAPTLDVAVDQSVRIVAEARDPDFALKRVRLVGESKGRQVLRRDLLEGDGRGRFVARTEVTPEEVGLQPGDVLDYWVEASDNRTPEPGVALSERRQIRVVGPANEQGDQQRGDQEQGENGAPNEGPEGDPSQDQQGQPNSPSADGGSRQTPADQNNSQEDQEQQEGQQQQGEQQQGSEGQSQQGESEGEEGDEAGSPPQGGLTGAGDQGGEQSEDPTGGEGAEGSGDSQGSEDSQQQGGSQQSGSQDSQEGADQNSSPSADGGSRQSNSNDTRPNQDGQRQEGQQSEGGEGQDSQPVARDGSDDGSAFDRIRDWLNGGDQQGEQREPSNRNQGDRGQDQSDQQGNESQDPSEGSQSSEPNDSQSSDPSAEGGSPRTEPNQNGQPQSNQQGQPQNQQGADGDSRSASDQGQNQPRDGRPGEQPDRPDDGPGAGERDRSGQQSDSTNSESGEQTDPGDSTDPQAGPRQGTGSSGQNEAADQGAGQSADRGPGDSSGREGGEQESQEPTGGEQSNQRGEGSQTRESTEGQQDQPGDDQQQSPSAEGGSPQSNANQPGSNQEGQQGQPSEGQPSEGQPGEGDQSNDRTLQDRRGEGPTNNRQSNGRDGPMELADRGSTDDRAGEGTEIGGDDANLDYARKQTDLVLKRLEEELRDKEVDRKLLDKLGWTDDDLRRFVDRWKSRKQQAQQRGAEGEAELDRALRSLGLNEEGPSRAREVSEDSLRDLNQRARTSVPPRLRGPLEWFQRSVNAAGQAEAADR